MRTPMLTGLGQALRWLRERQDKKQYQVADTAGITKGMLSAYETGRQRPSLETLEKILDTLQCDLNDLHNAIQIINGRPEGMRRRGQGVGSEILADPEPETESLEPSAGRTEVQRVLGRSHPLGPEEERALGEMLDGFHKFLRYLHSTIAQARQKRDSLPGGTDNPGDTGSGDE